MSIAGIIASLILALIVFFWVSKPFLERQTQTIDPKEQINRQRERLQRYYERILRNIHDLDEDRATGKLNEEDYNADRSLWMRRGIEVLKRIDQLDTEHLIAPIDADDAMIDEAIDQTIDSAVYDYQEQTEGT